MEAEFSRDDNGKIWFISASKILVEAVERLSDYHEDLMLHSVSHVRAKPAIEENAEQLSLAITDEDYTEKSRQLVTKMTSYYEHIKEKSGINEVLANDPVDHVTNRAFA
jgi:hypothetical protein